MKKEAAIREIKAHLNGKSSSISKRILGEIAHKLRENGAKPPFYINAIKTAYTSQMQEISTTNATEGNFFDEVNEVLAAHGWRMSGEVDPTTGVLTIAGMPIQIEGVVSLAEINDKAQNIISELSKTELSNGKVQGTVEFSEENSDNPSEKNITFRVDDIIKARFDPLSQSQLNELKGVVYFPQIQEELESEGESYGSGEITVQ